MCCYRPKKGLFDNLVDKEEIVIYLSRYNLDSVPSDIGKLKNAKSLYISKDSADAWTIYPPMLVIAQLREVAPVRELPKELTKLSKLQNLGLVGLDLKRLPDDFGKLQNLDSLNLMLNKLVISEELEKL